VNTRQFSASGNYFFVKIAKFRILATPTNKKGKLANQLALLPEPEKNVTQPQWKAWPPAWNAYKCVWLAT